MNFRERPVATLTNVPNMLANLGMGRLMERSVLRWSTVVFPSNWDFRRQRFLYLIATHGFHLTGLRSQAPSAPSVSEMNGSNDGLLADWLTTWTRAFSRCCVLRTTAGDLVILDAPGEPFCGCPIMTSFET